MAWLNLNDPALFNGENSDTSDEDYAPGGETDVSEEDDDGEAETNAADDDVTIVSAGRTRHKAAKSTRKRARIKPASSLATAAADDGRRDDQQDELAAKQRKITAEQEKQNEKQKADRLFADFMSDVKASSRRRISNNTSPTNSTSSLSASSISASSVSAASVSASACCSSTAGSADARGDGGSASRGAGAGVTKLFDFAGETVRVYERTDVDGTTTTEQSLEPGENIDGAAITASSSLSTKTPAATSIADGRQTSVGGGGGGLAALVGRLGKQPAKMNVLQKTALDWAQYKQQHQLHDELTQHARSNHSYLEKQEFLLRADHRQFEQEKEMRHKHRTPR